MHWKLLLSMVALSRLAESSPIAPPPEAAAANNALTFALLPELSQGDENLAFSPFSVWSALAMTSAGAEGKTLDQMRKVLHLPQGDAAHALVGGWARELSGLEEVEFRTANHLWGAKGLPFLDSFLTLTSEHYGASLETMDFVADPAKARTHINDWVAAKTKGHIKDLLKPDNVTGGTRLVLTNAVYFKGKWLSPFRPARTADHPFTLASGEKVTVRMMAAQMRVPYMEDGRLQAVRLSYRGREISMIVVLPRNGDALTSGTFLDADGFAKVQKELAAGPEVQVQLPRFEASDRMSLPKVLAKLGMEKVFTDQAELGRLCKEPLKVSEVIHQAWVKVEEEGTEAAAATAVVAVPGAAMPREEPKRFVADHPFLFFIVDERNGGVLFAGKVMNPRQ